MRLRELRVLTIKTKNVDLRVCRRCWEKDHPQLRLGSTPVEDVQALRAPRPDFAGYPSSRAAIVPVTGYLSGIERTFGLGQVGFVIVIAPTSVTVPVTGVQANSSIGTVTVYTAYGLTSQPYAIAYTESVDSAATLDFGRTYSDVVESTDNSAAFVSGDLRDILQTYTLWPAESTDNSAAFGAGVLTTVLVTYGNYAPESTDNAAAFGTGVLTTVLISYNNYAVESTDNSAAFVSGVLA